MLLVVATQSDNLDMDIVKFINQPILLGETT